jgi:hypothetical protein
MPFSARIGFNFVFAQPSGFPAWPIVPTQDQMNTELQTNFVSSGNATAVVSSFSGLGLTNAAATTAAQVNRRNGVAHPNGNIYLLPFGNANIVVYDTASNVMTSFDTGVQFYMGGAVSGFNGNIYMPVSASANVDILEINVAPLAVRQINGLANIPAANQHRCSGGISLGDDILFLNTGTTLANSFIYKPQSNTAVDTSIKMSTSNEIVTAVYHPNGKIYAAPYLGTQMIEYDPTTNITRRFGISGVSFTANFKYGSGCLGADNKLYFSNAADRNDVLIYDPVANVGSQQTYGLSLASSQFFGCSTLGADGNIYSVPSIDAGNPNSNILVICTDINNPAYNTAILNNFGITAPGGRLWGITAGANNKLLATDQTSTQTWLITTNGSGSTDALLSPYINKGV